LHLPSKKQLNRLVAKTKQPLNARKSTEKIAVKANRLQNANIQTVKLVLNLPMEKLVAKQDKHASAEAKPACCQGKPASECKHSEGKACAKSADGKACCKAGEHKEEPKK
jgi:hypothetical protein